LTGKPPWKPSKQVTVSKIKSGWERTTVTLGPCTFILSLENLIFAESVKPSTQQKGKRAVTGVLDLKEKREPSTPEKREESSDLCLELEWEGTAIDPAKGKRATTCALDLIRNREPSTQQKAREL